MNIWRPFTQMKTSGKPLRLKGARGADLILDQGDTLIDAISSWWVITHGHCHPKIMKAIGEQAQVMDQVLFAQFDHSSSEKLIRELRNWVPNKLQHVFFSDNGSTSVEVALKMVAQYWKQKGEGQRKLFLTFKNSYHGDTVGSMSVSGKSLFTSPYEEMLFEVKQLNQGYRSDDHPSRFTEDFLKIIETQAEKIAGLIIEPLIQGAGGMVVWPKEAVETLVRACQKKSIPVIFDEVMTGFGRTGEVFAFNHLDVVPDLLCLSKGLTGGSLPLALTLATDEIYEAFLDEEKSKMFFHGHSFTGNPISCAAAVANLELMKESNAHPQWRFIEEIHRKRIEEMKEKFPLKDSRICGTMGAVELHDDHGYSSKIGDQLMEFVIERGVYLRPLGSIIYVLPPYCITDVQLNKVWDVIVEFLEKSYYSKC